MDWIAYCKILGEEEEEVVAGDHLPLVATPGPGRPHSTGPERQS